MNKTILNNHDNTIDIHIKCNGYNEITRDDWKTMVYNQLKNEIYNEWYMDLLHNTELIIDNIYDMYEKNNNTPIKILLYNDIQLYQIDIINALTGEIIYINSL